MKPRCRPYVTSFTLIFCLCTTGSTKSESTFDISKSTAVRAIYKEKVKDVFAIDKIALVLPIAPPQPRNKKGSLTCTKNRYIQDERQIGIASWYGPGFDGALTANGERFNRNANTLAHLTLPMGTEVLVENPETGVSIRARVNDCGPFIEGRIADLSANLALILGIKKRGTGTIIITVL